MSVIKRILVTPNRVAILFHFLKGFADGVKADELEALLNPAALGKGEEEEGSGSTGAVVLNEAQKLGLVQDLGDKVVAVPTELRGLDDTGLLDFLEQRLVRPDLAQNCEQEQVPKALAWLLIQDPAQSLIWSQRPAWATKEIHGYDMTNNSRYQNMGYWARYLGYAWRFELGNRNLLVPDPTEALERHLRAILSEGQRMEIAQLVAQLALRSPILEGGSVRQELEERLPAEKRRRSNALSASTSVALMRLSRRGVIHFERAADAEAMLLSPWAQSQPISHVELIG